MDTLFEGISIERLAKITDIAAVRILIVPRRSGHTYLGRGVEIVQNLSPFRVRLRGSTVALIHHYYIKEVPVELLIRLRSALWKIVLHKLLIEAHKNLVALIGTPLLYLNHLLTKGFEVLEHSLVYQNVSIRQVENPHIAALA